MIEILPNCDSFRGSYDVISVVDIDAYLYIYNEVFVEDWNEYIKKMKSDSYFIKSKWIPVESHPSNGISLETVKETTEKLARKLGSGVSPENCSHEEIEMVEAAQEFSKAMEFRRDKKGRYFQKLVSDFDRERNLIACYNSKFYTYETSKYVDFISVYLIEKIEITNILNCLYLKIKKRNRVTTKRELLGNF